MSLTDVLEGAIILGGAATLVYMSNKLLKNNYIPFTENLEKELDKHPELDGYKFSDNKKEDKPVEDVNYNKLYWNALTKPFKDMCKIGRK